jgi:hypothetical protein
MRIRDTARRHLGQATLAPHALSEARVGQPSGRDHGFTVEDVSNAGLAPLIIMHDGAHGGVHCFAEAETALPEDGLKNGLRSLRSGLNLG